jgi:outer membrane biosynthesis protein TonB
LPRLTPLRARPLSDSKTETRVEYRAVRIAQQSRVGIFPAVVSLLAQTDALPKEPKASMAPQIEEAAKLAARQRGSSGPIEILTDTQAVDFTPYLSRVLHAVKQNWCSHVPEVARPPQSKKGKVVLEFAILKDGHSYGLQVPSASPAPSGNRQRSRAGDGEPSLLVPEAEPEDFAECECQECCTVQVTNGFPPERNA